LYRFAGFLSADLFDSCCPAVENILIDVAQGKTFNFRMVEILPEITESIPLHPINPTLILSEGAHPAKVLEITGRDPDQLS